MNRFEDMQAFVAVAETGSFTAAAVRLGTDKSVVSRRVAGLETRLDVQLLKRTTRTSALTQTGQSFYLRATQLLADLDEAEAAVTQEHGELRGRLRVALPLSFGLKHMADPIEQFSRINPAVTFDLDLSDRHVDLIQEDIDVAIRIGKLQDSSLIARRLFDSEIVVAASPAYLEQHGEPATPDDLRKHDCLSYSNLADNAHWPWIENGVQRSATVNVRMTANNGDILSQAAARGLGIVMQPSFIAHQQVRDGNLVPILTTFNWPRATAFAVYPPTRHLSYRVRAFIDFLADYFSGELYWDDDCANAARTTDQN